jgi:hypothetical protein
VTTDQLFDGVNGRDIISGHANADRTQLFVTKPHQMPHLDWLRRDPKSAGPERDRSAGWLRNAMIALGVLAVAAAIVSYAAQYQFVLAAKKLTAIAALEAGIPDAAAVIFACLGIALALQGRRAVRARVLNVGAVATSIFMNFASAAGTGWRDVAIWTMPPIAYALASDTAIGVVRAWAIARQKALNEALSDDEASPLAILGRVVLYGLRLVVAPPSTAIGARRALLNATPLPELPAASADLQAIAPPPEPKLIGRDPYDDLSDLWVVDGEIERRAHEFAPGERFPAGIGQCRLCSAVAHTTDDGSITDHLTPWGVACEAYAADDDGQDYEDEREQLLPGETKTAAFLRLVAKTYGPLAGFPLVRVSKTATELAPRVGLHPGSARSALKAAVVAATDEALGGAA